MFVQYGHFDKQIFIFTNSFSKTVDKAINMAALLTSFYEATPDRKNNLVELFTCFYEAIPDRNVTGAKWDLAVSETYAFSKDHIQTQGQTLVRIGLYLPTPVSSFVQMYVAVFTVRHWSCIKAKVSGADHHNR